MTRILVVDNSKSTCLGMANHFLDRGFEVAVADSEAKAFKELYDADPLPDIILLNLYMPAFEGWFLLQKLAKHDKYKNIGIVLTSHGEDKDLSMSFDSACLAAHYVEVSGLMAHFFNKEWAASKHTVA